MRGPQNPDQQNRDESGGQHIGGDHRKAHGQRQWNEEIVRRALHEEGGDKNCEDAEHREEAGTRVSTVPSWEALARAAPRPRCEWTFSMTTVASSTRMPTAKANPPSVIRL